MRARNAELSRPQSFTSFQSSAGERHRDDSRQAWLSQRHALPARLRRRGGERAHSSGQRGQTQRTHTDHRSDATSCAGRRDHGARPYHRPVPCVRAARGAVRYRRVCHQLHCTGEFGWRGSGDQPRILESSGDNYHRAESRAARAFFLRSVLYSFCSAHSPSLSRFSLDGACLVFRSLSISWARCLSRSVHSCRNWLLTWAW